MKDEFTYPDIKRLFGLSTARLTQIVTAGFIYPSIEKVSSGRKNRYSFDDMVQLSILLDLLAMRLPADNIRFIMGFYPSKIKFTQGWKWAQKHLSAEELEERYKEPNFLIYSAQDMNKSLLDGYTADERASYEHNIERVSFSDTNKIEISEDYNISIVINLRRKCNQVEAQIKALQE